MNVNQSVSHLKSFGWHAYPRTDGWVVYDRRGYNGFYTDRELIHLASGMRSNRWRPRNHPKTAIGCGGKWCTCCTKSAPSEMKKWERRAARRKNGKIEVDSI